MSKCNECGQMIQAGHEWERNPDVTPYDKGRVWDFTKCDCKEHSRTLRWDCNVKDYPDSIALTQIYGL